MRHVDKLMQLLRQYNGALDGLKPVECKLLKNEILKLNRFMDKGAENHNWFSLSIDQYIQECKGAIDTFNEKKHTVVDYANYIDKNVTSLECAQIIRQLDFERSTLMDIPDFQVYFESYRKKQLIELVKNYQDIGDQYLKQIEESTVKNQLDSSKSSDEMKPYYIYWERRIFNAITKMIVRALAANKTIWIRTEKPCLIRMSSTYAHPEVHYIPTYEELRTVLDKFTKNILESTKMFGRWWDGHCKIFEEINNEENAEKFIPYTFFDDVMQNKMITQLNYEIIKCKNQIIDKFDLISEALRKKNRLKELFDKGRLTKTQKSVEKNQSTTELERIITNFKQMRDQTCKQENTIKNYFVLIDNSDIKNATVSMIDKWLEMLGESLKSIANQELLAIIAQTENYNKELIKEIHQKETLQEFLEVIAEIKNISMEMEFRITEVQEQYRVLKMYDYPIDEDTQRSVDKLMIDWEELIEFAERQDEEVKGFKKNFSEVTVSEVEQFKETISKEYETYMSRGPGTLGIPLEEGLKLLADSKATIAEFNKQRLANVQAEKLFNLEISKYPQLVEMEERNKRYDLIYDIFDDFAKRMGDFGQMYWLKLDTKLLLESAENFKKSVKRLGSKNPDLEIMSPFIQLSDRVNSFSDSLPLIQALRHDAVQERHWMRIMEETGKEAVEINIKSLSLSRVFELDLGKYEEQVNAICHEAKEEAKNEEAI
jgi:dynein heavy chain